MRSGGGKRGFTLVEIMIVVVIIGLLAALAIPAFNRARERSQATALANNFRTYAAAFEVYCMDHGDWPADENRGVIPAGMEGQLPRYTEPTIVGGNWDWDPGVLGYTAAVTLVGSTASTGLLLQVDEILDDGDPTTGNVRFNGTHLSYVLEF